MPSTPGCVRGPKFWSRFSHGRFDDDSRAVVMAVGLRALAVHPPPLSIYPRACRFLSSDTTLCAQQCLTFLLVMQPPHLCYLKYCTFHDLPPRTCPSVDNRSGSLHPRLATSLRRCTWLAIDYVSSIGLENPAPLPPLRWTKRLQNLNLVPLAVKPVEASGRRRQTLGSTSKTEAPRHGRGSSDSASGPTSACRRGYC